MKMYTLNKIQEIYTRFLDCIYFYSSLLYYISLTDEKSYFYLQHLFSTKSHFEKIYNNSLFCLTGLGQFFLTGILNIYIMSINVIKTPFYSKIEFDVILF